MDPTALSRGKALRPVKQRNCFNVLNFTLVLSHLRVHEEESIYIYMQLQLFSYLVCFLLLFVVLRIYGDVQVQFCTSQSVLQLLLTPRNYLSCSTDKRSTVGSVKVRCSVLREMT